MTKNIISLIGMTGCGKSTVGRALSDKLGYRFIDMDDYITATSGKTPREIFDETGEGAFRQLERSAMLKVISSVGKDERCVLSCGGGIITREENINDLKNNTIVIWIKRATEEVAKNPEVFKRPPINGSIYNYLKLYNSRQPFYSACAHHVLEHSDVQKTVNNIIELLITDDLITSAE